MNTRVVAALGEEWVDRAASETHVEAQVAQYEQQIGFGLSDDFRFVMLNSSGVHIDDRLFDDWDNNRRWSLDGEPLIYCGGQLEYFYKVWIDELATPAGDSVTSWVPRLLPFRSALNAHGSLHLDFAFDDHDPPVVLVSYESPWEASIGVPKVKYIAGSFVEFLELERWDQDEWPQQPPADPWSERHLAWLQHRDKLLGTHRKPPPNPPASQPKDIAPERPVPVALSREDLKKRLDQIQEKIAEGDKAAVRDELNMLLHVQRPITGPNSKEIFRIREMVAALAVSRSDTLAMYKEVISDLEQSVGRQHPDTFAIREKIATMTDRNDIERRRSLLQELLRDRIAALGSDDRDTLRTRKLLAGLGPSHEQWRDQLAELILDLDRVFGPDDPDTLTSRTDLAYLCAMTGDSVKAMSIYEDVLHRRTRLLGPEHPEVLHTKFGIATTTKAFDSASALAQFQELLPDLRRVMGPGHWQTHAVERDVKLLST